LSTKYSNFDDNLPIDEYYELHLNILKELLRVSDMVFYNIQIVTGSKRAIFKIIGDLSDYLKDIVIWDKGHGQPAMAERVMNRRTELVLIFDKNNAISRQFDKCNFNRGTLDDLWLIKRGKKVSSEHGAVFPEELVYTILNNFTNEGDVIYDPFMGTGSTAVVSKKLKRNYIGSEISNEYMKVINERLSGVSETLF
jgi:site-specific DNA-methyltransferase (adenine-specific)/modification methylase